jgi:hypothetical protein
MNSQQRKLQLAAFLAVCLGANGCSAGKPSGLSGTWVKKSGDPDMPQQVILKEADHRFEIRYYKAEGIATVTLICDGLEHPFSQLPPRMTYNATLQGNTLIVTKRMKSLSNIPTDVDYTERWSVSGDGRDLTVTAPGARSTFGRMPFIRSLFASAP